MNQRLKKSKGKKKRGGFFGPNYIWTMCRIFKRGKYKRREMITYLKPRGVKRSPALVTNWIFVSSLVPHRTKEKRKQKRGKARTTKAKFPTKIQPYKVLLIHDDCAYYLWFDGNDLQNQSTIYLWFGIRMKHLPVWDFIHLERFYFSFPSSHIVFLQKYMLCVLVKVFQRLS